MKFLFFYLLSALIFINGSIAQSTDSKEVPAKIKDAFAVKYPSANIKKWSFKNDVYTANFITDNKKSITFFDSNGAWIRTETIVARMSKLPLAIKNGFSKSQFAAWTIERIKKHETSESTFYGFLINNGNLLDGDHHDVFLKKYTLDFSSNGILLIKTIQE